ncbi:Rhs element Vgr protein [Caballeronia arvi]|uniref:Rhs element Vgr protein n=1 Tax=Caballeronia arvi TaxID=1777135 RepID=A0A158H249_9BURK|nr:type VI secretion system tip protein VgrG [Caballeronia arvi]SAL38432.1 Rhs element Vgr protein [Caballeronia arvi]
MASPGFLTALKDPNAWVSQHLSLTVAGLTSVVDPLEYTLKEEMNELFQLDILIYSDDQTLDGADFLGKNVTLVIEERAELKYMGTASRHARTVHGVVRELTHESSSKDGAQYRLLIQPRVSLLDLTKDSDVFLKKTLKEIFYELLVDRERIFPHDIELNFEGVDQRYDQLLMADETAIGFIRRQCLRHGLYSYIKHAEVGSKTHRDTLVIDNRPNGYMRSIDMPFAPPNGQDGGFHEAILSMKRKQTLLPQSVELRDHNFRTPSAPVSAIAYVDRGDKTLYGTIDRSTEHFHTKEEAQALAKVRTQAIGSKQVVHIGTSNIVGLYPGWVLNATNHKFPKAPYGLVITKMTTTGSRSKPAKNEFEGTPADKIWRPEYVPERDWRWMQGSIVATIESSAEGSPYPDLDQHGLYLVKFHFHRSAGKPGSNSMRLRLMLPSAARDGGFHAPLLPGTEVRIFFTNGDVDRPYIGFAAHDYSHANHVHGYEGWSSREVWRSALLANKVRFENFKGKEGAKFATIYQKSAVSMGYLVDNQKQLRGEGLEAFTRKHMAMRAGTGMFLVVDPQADPNKPQLEMQRTKMQLDAALSQMQNLADLASAAQALAADVERQRQMLTERIDGLKQAVLLASAPDGIALTSGQHLQFSAQANIAAIAGGNADYGAMRSLTLAAGDGASVYANQGPLKVIAQKGRMQLQAQGNAMDVASKGDMTITSSTGEVRVSSDKAITLYSGGAYIKLSGGNIEIVCPGELTLKGGTHARGGPGSAPTPGYSFADGKELDPHDHHFVLKNPVTGEPLSGVKYRVVEPDGTEHFGTTDAAGKTNTITTNYAQSLLKMHIALKDN